MPRFLPLMLIGLLILLPAPAAAQSTSPDAEQAVRAANAEFYRAFHDRDMAGMAEIWGTAEPITVIHPGWPELTGRAAVLQSWQAIFAGPASPRIRHRNATVRFKDGLAEVVNDEILPGGVLRALNVYRREGGAWKLIHHEAVVPEGTGA